MDAPGVRQLPRWSAINLMYASRAHTIASSNEHDRRENELSLIHGFCLLSAYKLSNGTKVLIITEADRSATTILLPDEY
jgi:hypothetical protein